MNRSTIILGTLSSNEADKFVYARNEALRCARALRALLIGGVNAEYVAKNLRENPNRDALATEVRRFFGQVLVLALRHGMANINEAFKDDEIVRELGTSLWMGALISTVLDDPAFVAKLRIVAEISLEDFCQLPRGVAILGEGE